MNLRRTLPVTSTCLQLEEIWVSQNAVNSRNMQLLYRFKNPKAALSLT